ncbi:hypothetical protein [Maribacter zhoushanensis]|uniref:hypothetical protein n=1 Tax=Maribacter zhoushanensis TaxID=3030012 RepID=UPI0023EDA7F1|nr:hypothetical protein [Maribacter zhoushanensis]
MDYIKFSIQKLSFKVFYRLLKEIGKERKDAELYENKPLSMDGFYVQFEPDTLNFNLYYKYPSRVIMFIIPVLGYWNVPIDNWVRERK